MEEGLGDRSLAGRRVLHVLRSDHESHVGGDLGLLHASVAALQSLGVDAVASTVKDGPDSVDLVHFYNATMPAALTRAFQIARRRWPTAALALSPLYWPPQFTRMLRSRSGAASHATKQLVKDAAWWVPLRAQLKRFDLIVLNAPSEARALARHFRLARDSSWKIAPNAIWQGGWSWRRDPERQGSLRALGLDPALRTIVACIGRLEPRKNQRVLIDAVDRLPHTGLILIGPDGMADYAASVRSAAAARKRHVKVMGSISADEIRKLLAICDIHALPAFFELPGCSSIEAAALGCEVVTTRVGSAQEYFGDTAHYVDPWSPASVAAGIERARRSPRQPATRDRIRVYDWSYTGAALSRAYAHVFAAEPVSAEPPHTSDRDAGPQV